MPHRRARHRADTTTLASLASATSARTAAVMGVAAPIAAGVALTTGQMSALPVARTVPATATTNPADVALADNMTVEPVVDQDYLNTLDVVRARNAADRAAEEAARKALADEAARKAAEEAAAAEQARQEAEAQAAAERERQEQQAKEEAAEVAASRAELPEPENAPEATPRPTQTADATTISIAKRYIGTPYVWGGTSPSGFDCSGFVQYVHKKIGVDLPRTSKEQARMGTAVSEADAQPGDLVAFGSPVHHIGIYLGDGMMIDAPRRGKPVDIHKVWRSERVQFRRL